MRTAPPHTLALAAIVVASVALGTGCYVGEGPPPEPPPYAYGYEPQYYDGYVVYYDDVGRPFYYLDGSVVWVPPSSPLYIGFVNHWHHYGPAYRAWYGHHGYRYRSYRGYGHRR